MIDWEGLLKFSLKYTDGTKKSEFKEMDSNDKKWLEEAMQHYCNSQITRIKTIMHQLQKFTELEQQTTLLFLEELQELLDSLDKGTALYKIGGHITILKIIFYSKSDSCRQIAMQIYSSANQNDAMVQNQSINTGALEMIELLKKQTNMRMKQNLLTAISATIRGQNLEAKRIFIHLNGLQLLQQQLKSASARLTNKIYILWRDLIYYDGNLDKTFNDLSAFSNTSNLKAEKKQHYDLDYDVNAEQRSKNQLPQNAKFKGCVKKFMQSNQQLFQNYLKWLKQQIANE